jgi:hypothetical protein
MAVLIGAVGYLAVSIKSPETIDAWTLSFNDFVTTTLTSFLNAPFLFGLSGFWQAASLWIGIPVASIVLAIVVWKLTKNRFSNPFKKQVQNSQITLQGAIPASAPQTLTQTPIQPPLVEKEKQTV